MNSLNKRSRAVIQRIFLVIFLAALSFCELHAQDVEQVIKADPLQVSGGITNSNIWTQSTNPNKDFDYSLYLSGNVSFNFYNLVTLPVSFAYTNRQLTKACTSPFNRLSLAPQYKWIKTYIGYGSMSFSPYTMSGREFMGGGIELTPDKPWKLMVFGGRTQKAVGATEYSDASYKMRSGGFLFGYKAQYFDVTLNMIKAKDVKNSLPYMPSDSAYVSPRDNIAGSVKAEVHILENLSFSGEYALSVLNNNYDADTTAHEKLFDNSGNVVRYRAGRCNLTQVIPIGSVGVAYERIDPNYTTLGTYYNTEDFERMSLDVQLNFLEKIQFNGSIGYEHDNLKKQEVNTNAQVAFSADLSAQPIEKLNLSFSASNTQEYVHVRDIIETITQTNQYQNLDTLSYTEMNLSLSTNANYQFDSNEDFPQTVSGGFSYQRASHDQEHYTRFVSNKLRNTNLSYSIRHTPTKIFASLALNWNNTVTPESENNVYTSTLSASYPVIKALKLSASAGYSWIRSTADYNILNARVAASTSFLSHHSLSANVSCVHNNSSTVKQKNKLSANLTYTYSFGCALKREDKHLSFTSDF